MVNRRIKKEKVIKEVPYKKQIFEIVNTDDIKQRLHLACNILTSRKMKQAVCGYNNDLDWERPSPERWERKKRLTYLNFYSMFREERNLLLDRVIDEEDPRFYRLIWAELDSVEHTYNLYRCTDLFEILECLIFTKDIKKRMIVYDNLDEFPLLINSKKKYNEPSFKTIISVDTSIAN